MMARERGPSDPTSQPTPIMVAKRSRAKTLASALYDSDYKEFVREMCPSDIPRSEPWNLGPPANITTPEEFTDETIRHAYFYAHYRVKFRKVSPRSIASLEQYRDTAKAAMAKPTKEARIELATLNRILHSKVILYKEPTLKEKEAQEAIRKLVEMRYLADYGDYMAEQCKRFREEALEKNVAGSGFFTGRSENWMTVQERMQQEETSYRNWMREGRLGVYPEQPTVRAVEKACVELGLSIDNTRFAIRRYAQRNEAMHSKVGFHIQQCDWPQLAVQLWTDLRELPRIFGDEEYREMKKILEHVRDRYFLSLHPIEPVPSARASELTMARHEKLRRRLATATSQPSTSRSSRKDSTVVSEEAMETGRRERRLRVESSSELWETEDIGFGLDGLGF